jgi:hypothetical protein
MGERQSCLLLSPSNSFKCSVWSSRNIKVADYLYFIAGEQLALFILEFVLHIIIKVI